MRETLRRLYGNYPLKMIVFFIKQVFRAIYNGQYPANFLRRRDMINTLTKLPCWEDKIKYFKQFTYTASSGVWIRTEDESRESMPAACTEQNYPKVHYGCGGTIMEGWLNVDLYDMDMPGYKKVDLLNKHPFADKSICFGFSEDMFEHFNQAESIFFLGEVFRTLAPGGILRLSFPGLEGVMLRHYSPAQEKKINEGEFEAYHFWDHLHFYSKAEISLVAAYIGFREINFVEFGQSQYSELRNLDHRIDQSDLNIYVELVK